MAVCGSKKFSNKQWCRKLQKSGGGGGGGGGGGHRVECYTTESDIIQNIAKQKNQKIDCVQH